jgi:type II secretory pathway component PulF
MVMTLTELLDILLVVVLMYLPIFQLAEQTQ